MMHSEPTLLAKFSDLGSVSRCVYGCVHVQLGHTVIVLTEEQYMRFVAMVCESAANFEVLRGARERDAHPGWEPGEGGGE